MNLKTHRKLKMFARKENTTIVSLAVLVAIAAFTGGCSKTQTESKAPGKTVEQNEPRGTAQPSASTSSQSPEVAEGKTGEGQDPGDLPEITEASKKINMREMPDSLVIVTVAGRPITIGDYKRQYRMGLRGFQDMMTVNPDAAKVFLEEAKKRNIQLTADERKQYLDAAKLARGSTPEAFKKFLKASNMTEGQFDKLVLDEALANKVFKDMQTESLLKDMIDKELFAAAARSAGFSKKAFNKFMEFKKSPNYEIGLKRSGLPADLYRDDILNKFLILYMQDKIVSEAPVTDEEARKFYEAHRDSFKHGERARMAQILVAATVEDMPPHEGLKSKIVRLKPDISPMELEEAIKAKKEELRKKAESLLERAKRGEDFATLANENSDEVRTRAAKTGGDAGWVELMVLTPELREKIAARKAGEVIPEVIPNELGFFVVKVLDRQPPGILSFAEIKEGLKSQLLESNAQLALTRWIKEKRRSTNIGLSPEFHALVFNASTKQNVR
ncbi:MAG TPA: peptidylprolyl isomerase [Candidatus Obscuribacterales bacterium]